MEGPARYVPSVDGLRGIALLLVFLAHMIALPISGDAVGVDGTVRALARFGWTGVDLFFVLSGFLITGILLDTKGQPYYWRNYFARRCLRIVPLYYGSLTFLFVLLPRLVHWSEPAYATLQANQAWYWTYTVNFLQVLQGTGATPLNTGHFWSLSIEEQYYFFWPFVVLLVSPRALVRVAACTMAFGLVFRTWFVLIDPIQNAPAAYVFTPGRLDGLMAGAVLAVWMREPGGVGVLRRLASRGIWMAAAALLGLTIWRRGFEREDPATAIIVYPVIAVFYAALLCLALTSPASSALRRLLSGSHLRHWGIYSYGLYVLHLPLLGVLDTKLAFLQSSSLVIGGSHLPSVMLRAAIAVPSTYALAWLSYHIYEKQFLALKRHFAPAGRTHARYMPTDRLVVESTLRSER